jgi:hypothetical protein
MTGEYRAFGVALSSQMINHCNGLRCEICMLTHCELVISVILKRTGAKP